MFLARGRVPVWANKVQVNHTPSWNNRPNDLYFATHFLWETRESEMAWVLADLERPAHEWMVAPIAYLSTDTPIELSPAQLDNLRRYVALGGMLVVNPETNRAKRWAEALCEQLYPQYPLQNLPANHFLYGGLGGKQSRGRGMAQAVHNGARELVLVFNDDLGHTFQRDENPDLKTPAWRLLFNLFLLTTGRGNPHGRLASPFVNLKPIPQPAKAIRLGVARYTGNDRPEPAAYTLANHFLAERYGVTVEPVDVHLENLDTNDSPPLLHLSGIQAVEWTPNQLDRLETYARNGGTVLVETVGGQGDFVASVADALQQRLGASERVSRRDPLFRGDNGRGKRMERIIYRQYTIEKIGSQDQPLLRAIRLDDRPAVILSYEDITLGLMRSNHYLINGYSPDTATDLFANLLLQRGWKTAMESVESSVG